MDITVSTKELREFVKCCKSIKGRRTLLILDNFKIEVIENKEISLSFTNLEIWIKYQIQGTVNSNSESILLPIDSLNSVLVQQKEDSIRIKKTEDTVKGFIELIVGQKSILFPIDKSNSDVQDYPVFSEEKEQYKIKANKEYFFDLIGMVEPQASRDELRTGLYLTCLFRYTLGNRFEFCSTNGHELIYIRDIESLQYHPLKPSLKDRHVKEDIEQFCVSISQIPSVLKASKLFKSNTIDIILYEHDNSPIDFHSKEYTIRVRKNDCVFPQFETVIPIIENRKRLFDVNRKEFIEKVKEINAYTKKGDPNATGSYRQISNILSLKIKSSGVVIDAISTGIKGISTNLHTFNNNTELVDELNIWLNPLYVLDTLQSIKTEEVSVYTNQNQPINNQTILIIPKDNRKVYGDITTIIMSVRQD